MNPAGLARFFFFLLIEIQDIWRKCYAADILHMLSTVGTLQCVTWHQLVFNCMISLDPALVILTHAVDSEQLIGKVHHF